MTSSDDALKADSVAGYAAREPDAFRFAGPLTLWMLFAAGTALRFLFLARKPFWFDECFSVEAARLDWGNFAHLLWWREANMSLYYLLLRGWLHFGGTEFFIRSLSVIFAVAALPALYWLGLILFDRRTSVIAVALLSANAYHIRYAQEARSYSLFFLLSVLSSACFCAYLQRPSQRHLFGYVATSILAVYAHFYALLLISTQLASLWFSESGPLTSPSDGVSSPVHRLRQASRWIGVAVLPLVVFITKTGAGPIRWLRRPGLSDLFNFYQHVAGNGGWLLSSLYGTAALVALVPSVLSLMFAYKSGRRSRGFGRRTWSRGRVWGSGCDAR